MNRIAIGFLVFSLLAFCATIVTTTMQERAYDQQMNRLDKTVEEAEKDLGIYDADSAKSTPSLKRAMRVSLEARERADESRKLLDSLAKADREAMGDLSVNEDETSDTE